MLASQEKQDDGLADLQRILYEQNQTFNMQISNIVSRLGIRFNEFFNQQLIEITIGIQKSSNEKLLEEFKKEMLASQEKQDDGLADLNKIIFQQNQTFNVQINNHVSQ